MPYSYFPGCTLPQQERPFDSSFRAIVRALELDVTELEAWQCCGAVFPLAEDALMPLVSPFRSLVRAREQDRELVTLCSGCFNVLRRTAHRVNTDSEVRDKLLAFSELEWPGELVVKHGLELLDDLGEERLRAAIARDVSDVRVACYYGCLLVRPSAALEFDDSERPTIMDRVLSAVGVEVVSFPHRTECCGAYLSVLPGSGARAGALSASNRVLAAAADRGADCLVTSCPLCAHNLRLASAERDDLPTPAVTYFTTILAHALGVDAAESGWESETEGVVSTG